MELSSISIDCGGLAMRLIETIILEMVLVSHFGVAKLSLLMNIGLNGNLLAKN
jgi:hypothetical protein